MTPAKCRIRAIPRSAPSTDGRFPCPVPNIVYIHSHDTGRYVQPYGHAIPTPHIQQLAEEGVLFRQAFCANPTCSPSRACLLTGQWAHSCGMTGLVNRGWTLPHPERLLTPYYAKGRLHHGHGRLPARGSGRRATAASPACCPKRLPIPKPKTEPPPF